MAAKPIFRSVPPKLNFAGRIRRHLRDAFGQTPKATHRPESNPGRLTFAMTKPGEEVILLSYRSFEGDRIVRADNAAEEIDDGCAGNPTPTPSSPGCLPTPCSPAFMPAP